MVKFETTTKKINRTSKKRKDDDISKMIDRMNMKASENLAKSAVENKHVFSFHFLNKLRDLIRETVTSVVQRSGNMAIVTPLIVPARSYNEFSHKMNKNNVMERIRRRISAGDCT